MALTMPLDAMIVAPKHHGLKLEAPENGVEGAEPIAPQDQFVVVQADGMWVDDELLTVDGHGDVQGNMLAARDADLLYPWGSPRCRSGGISLTVMVKHGILEISREGERRGQRITVGIRK
jgi:hypothetical protein